ncbi:MAG: heparinase II/III family protein [Victivallales bacterium]
MKFKILALIILSAISITGAEPAKVGPNGNNAMDISSYLDDMPAGSGIRISDREKWNQPKDAEIFKKAVASAEKLLKNPMPPTSDALYLDYSKTGNREHWQQVAGKRRGRIKIFTAAECIENKGRFIPALEEAIADICMERTWVMPAHDTKLANFNGKITEIDLGSSGLANDMACAYFILGDSLSEKCRKTIEDNIDRRILVPFRNMMSGKQKMDWWINCTNNWNAVCLGNVTAIALTMVGPKQERAQYISDALKYSKFFLSGFTDDGYCSEGMGYWNYGFSHYMMLAEAILKATHGKINLFDDSGTRNISGFHSKIEIMNGVCPAFADCDIMAKPSDALVKFISYKYGNSSGEYENFSTEGGLFCMMIAAFPEETGKIQASKQEPGDYSLRTWFNNAGILICRPGKDSSCKIGAALKGGNNKEHHNHNDVGSYVIVIGKEPIILDPGAEVYTARTFSGKRYESNLLNSFGHPVPVVGGQLQKTGAEAKAKILKTDFTDDSDILEMDIRSAYPVNELKSLTRTFVYSRKGDGSLIVTDEVSFSKPMSFETAAVTTGTFEKKSDSSLIISSGEEKILVEFSSDAGKIEITSEEIKEETHRKVKPLRIGLKLKNPVEKAKVTVKYSPL